MSPHILLKHAFRRFSIPLHHRPIHSHGLTKGMLPIALIPETIRTRFAKGDCMLTAVFFDSGSSSDETMNAITSIRSIADERCFISGLSAVVTDTRNLVESQEAIYVGIAVALCALVLMLTMDSFLLPIIFLVCIGISVLWNLGSNCVFGEIRSRCNFRKPYWFHIIKLFANSQKAIKRSTLGNIIKWDGRDAFG